MRGVDTSASFGRVSTGVEGLDEVLHGGFPEHGVYLVRGGAGTGKTTLGLQFLLAGAAKGERCLFISLSQPTRMLTRMARAHGWTLDGIDIHAITPREVLMKMREQQDVFVSDEVELVDISDRVRELIEEIRPERLVFDSLSFIEMLATVPGRYAHELAALVELFGRLDVTAIFTINDGRSSAELVTDGIIELQHLATAYGTRSSRLAVTKIRGSDFLGGQQDYEIVRGGLRVYPRMTPAQVADGEAPREPELESGAPGLDELVGGGLAAGTSCLIMGPSGSGKTSIATSYAHAAATRGTKTLFFLFEELRHTFLKRSAALGMDLRPHIDADRMRVQQVERPAILPGEFATILRQGLEWGAGLVVVDSLSGYYQALPDERLLLTQIRDVVRFMNQRGTISILTLAHPMAPGAGRLFPLDVSETVDVKVLLQFFEANGSLQKGISVVKRRDGEHLKEVRELRIERSGVDVLPVRGHHVGMLGGRPTVGDDAGALV